MTTPAAPAAPASPTPTVPPAAPAPGNPNPPANPAPSPTPGNTEPTAFKIPEKYAKEPWSQGVKSYDDLFDQFHNAQGVIGKKTMYAPPPETATPEEKKNFLKAIGVPENPEGYEFVVLDELKDIPRDAKIDNLVKSELQKAGIPKSAGETLIKNLEKMVFEQRKPVIEAQAKIEKDFSALKLATFGDKVETVQAQFDEIMTETLGKDNAHLQAMYKTLTPEGRTVLLTYAKAIHDKFIGEHKITPPGPGNKGGLPTDLKSAYNELSAAKTAVRNDPNMPKHVKDQRIAELNKKMQEVGAKASQQGIDLFAK